MPAAIIITTTTIMSTADAAATLRLLAWLSPAFPTGGFAYSHGIEFAVEAGDIHDAQSARVWIEDVLRFGSARSDAILLRHAHRSAHNPRAIAELAELARATAASRERLLEATLQGSAFIAAASAWLRLPFKAEVPYAVAVGALAGNAGIDADAICCGYLQAFAANLISAAVRLVPLGQSAGLATLAALEPTILVVADATRSATLDDFGGACFRSDLSAMRHETQYTRLFRS